MTVALDYRVHLVKFTTGGLYSSGDGKDTSTIPMVKPQLPSLLAMIGYPINLGPTHPCMQKCFSEFKKVITFKPKI